MGRRCIAACASGCHAAGKREFWMVDLTSNRVLAHRSPRDGRYAWTAAVDMSGTAQVEALPDVTISVAQIFV
jgi:hypothetical protein